MKQSTRSVIQGTAKKFCYQCWATMEGRDPGTSAGHWPTLFSVRCTHGEGKCAVRCQPPAERLYKVMPRPHPSSAAASGPSHTGVINGKHGKLEDNQGNRFLSCTGILGVWLAAKWRLREAPKKPVMLAQEERAPKAVITIFRLEIRTQLTSERCGPRTAFWRV